MNGPDRPSLTREERNHKTLIHFVGGGVVAVLDHAVNAEARLEDPQAEGSRWVCFKHAEDARVVVVNPDTITWLEDA